MKIARIGLVVIVGISLLGVCSCSEPVAHETNGGEIMADDMLSTVMAYIKQNHPDATPFMKEGISWAKTSGPKQMGYTEATYTGDGWTVSIGHAVTAEVVYEVRAAYDKEGIVWNGTIKDEVITETNYTGK